MIARGRVLNDTALKSKAMFGFTVLKLASRHIHHTPIIFQEKKDAQVDLGVPWYLRQENSPPVEEIKKVEIPELPESAPGSLSELVHLIAEEYGIVDVEVFDLATLPEDHPKSVDVQSYDKYIILGTGKSEKHLYKAAYELKQYIKHHHDCMPVIEGMVSNSIGKVARRRLAKRVSRGPPATHSTYGIGANTWVSCDTGVDGITIHMLTKERRQEMNLEQLYSDAPDYESNRYTNNIDDDDIFYGIKRGFHTSTRVFNKADQLKVVYDELLENGKTMSLAKFKAQFDNLFSGASVEEYNRKVDFYKVISLMDEQLVTAEQVECIFKDKYSSLLLAQEQGIDWHMEVTNDIIKYMELLADVGDQYTPAQKLNKLSEFVSDMTNFTGDSVQLFSIDKFNALLWNLTTKSTFNQLDSAGIREVINTKGKFEPVVGKVEQDAKIERCVKELTRRSLPKEVFPLWFREQMMYTYGQTGAWDKFWKEFQSLVQSIGSSKDRVYFWVTTLIFLSKVNNRDALRTYFTKYWSSPSGYSFLKDFEKNDNRFNSDNERIVFKRTVQDIQNSYGSSPWKDEAVEFVENL